MIHKWLKDEPGAIDLTCPMAPDYTNSCKTPEIRKGRYEIERPVRDAQLALIRLERQQ